MTTNTLAAAALTLGGFLRDRRARLSPGPGATRRRTPGLRREEVAARAGVSITWYTWLEQGRGGPPSEHVLERLARALELDAAGREVMFLLAQQRPPPVRSAAPPPVPASLQRVLDAMPLSPAVVKTPTWDIVAWNRAALAVLANYPELPVEERNVLRRLFQIPEVRAHLPDWEADARFALATFRLDAARAGDYPEAAALAAELHATSADFRRLWAENEVRSHGLGIKRLQHPLAGLLTLEYRAFDVDAGGGLSLIVYTAATPTDARRVEKLLAGKGRRRKGK